jgi:hypothetical protein
MDRETHLVVVHGMECISAWRFVGQYPPDHQIPQALINSGILRRRVGSERVEYASGIGDSHNSIQCLHCIGKHGVREH